ncbi:MAG: sensor histidine kinase, partial [Bacteroidales bacterium]|nr:sensor histidine kinase [Bacteroidales bacterium]
QRIRQLEEEKKLLAAKSLVIGQEEERKRIAKELHDGLGVILSTAKMHFSKALESKTEEPDLIKKATRLLEQAATDVRRISHNMMPGVLTRLGLVEAIEDIFDELNEIPGTQAISSITGEEIRLPENTEIMLYRVFQEIINNTLKHANATEIGLNLNFMSDHLRISLSDNGKGFNVEEKMLTKSIGLNSIQSRVNFINGNLRLESSPGHGTNYNMVIPYPKNIND